MRRSTMIPAQQCAPRVLGDILRRQPLSPGKIRFAWRAAVGDAMAHATSVDLDTRGTLRVSAETEHWRRETVRSAGVIKRRLAELLGRDTVTRITTRSAR